MLLRDFTNDFTAFRDVYFGNEYRLPDKFAPEDVILDVGAHVGTFAFACLIRGAKRIVCYEACPENFKILKFNMDPYSDRVELNNLAVWRSDKTETLRLFRHANPDLNACNVVTASADIGEPVAGSIDFDGVLQYLGNVRLAKIDAEGSEYPILFTSQELSRIEEIVGESHAVNFKGCPFECSNASLVKFLNEHGFVAHGEPNPRCPPKTNAWFFAKRRPDEPEAPTPEAVVVACSELNTRW